MKEKLKVVMIPNNHDYIVSLKRSLEEKGVYVFLLPPFHYATPYNILKLLQLKLKGYILFHIHFEYVFPFTFFMKILIRLLKGIGYKVIWTIHDISSDYKYSNTKLRSKEKSRWLYQESDYKFVHYKSNIEKLKNCFDADIDNVEIIFHPYFNYKNNIKKEEARNILKIASNKKVLLSFGMIKRYKGHVELIESFEKLDDSFVCLIVGLGKHDIKTTKYLKNKAKKIPNLIFIDKYIQSDNIQIYFNASDVVVLPYKDITQSGIVPLAYSFSKPVITTNVGALSEMVIDGKTGLIIPPNDTEALTTAIKKIFTMDYKKIGENAYKLAQDKFTWEKLAEQTIKVYEGVVVNKNK